jgi:hypothetical protein
MKKSSYKDVMEYLSHVTVGIKYPVNTILHTKDGRRIGNAFIVGHEMVSIEIVSQEPVLYNILKTDYGDQVYMSDNEVKDFFHPPVNEVEGDIPGEKHKYYLEQIPYSKNESAIKGRGGEAPMTESDQHRDGLRLLSFLLEYQLSLQVSEGAVVYRTIGELVLISLNPSLQEWGICQERAIRSLLRVGMKVRGDQFIIDVNNAVIHDLLKDTDWKGNYYNALLGIRDMQLLPHEYFASGFPKKALGIHKSLLFKDFIDPNNTHSSKD